MKGIYGTTVNEEDVRCISNAITEIAMEKRGITLEVIETAVDRVKEIYATNATIQSKEFEG